MRGLAAGLPGFTGFRFPRPPKNWQFRLEGFGHKTHQDELTGAVLHILSGPGWFMDLCFL